MTHYVAVYLVLDLSIFEPFYVSIFVADSIIARRVYSGCVIFICGRKTLIDLIKLDMVDFKIILGMD